MNTNIILTGMPAAGKSTVGVLLAKRLGMNFIDTDIVIQQIHRKPLHQLLDRQNPSPFRQIEEDAICQLDISNHVIATGGSVIYGQQAMQHLAANGIIIYIYVSLPVLQSRLTNLVTRAVVMAPDQSLAELFDERHALYQQQANITIDATEHSQESVANAICQGLDNFAKHP